MMYTQINLNIQVYVRTTEPHLEEVIHVVLFFFVVLVIARFSYKQTKQNKKTKTTSENIKISK